MSAIGDFVKGVVTDVLGGYAPQDVVEQARQAAQAHDLDRRRAAATPRKPAKAPKRQASRRKTVRARSKAKRRAY